MRATSFLLINVSMGSARAVYERLEKLPQVQQADAITGPYDIIATLQGSDYSEIARVVIDKVQTIDGVTATLTCNVVNFEV
ncbi:MAG: Lrp/AsnC family transcriptional regulator [Thermoanaerobaculales bacterium]